MFNFKYVGSKKYVDDNNKIVCISSIRYGAFIAPQKKAVK